MTYLWNEKRFHKNSNGFEFHVHPYRTGENLVKIGKYFFLPSFALVKHWTYFFYENSNHLSSVGKIQGSDLSCFTDYAWFLKIKSFLDGFFNTNCICILYYYRAAYSMIRLQDFFMFNNVQFKQIKWVQSRRNSNSAESPLVKGSVSRDLWPQILFMILGINLGPWEVH